MLAFSRTAKKGFEMTYLPYRSTRQVFEETIVRKTQDLHEWFGEQLNEAEQCWILPDENGLSFRVALASVRAEDLLLRLHRQVLPTFNQPKIKTDESGISTAWFGYVEPWESLGVRFYSAPSLLSQ